MFSLKRKDNTSILKDGKRISHVDVAKGFMILLVVLGHCSATSIGDHSRLFYTIYAFHMPCWFFLSGLLYKRKEPWKFFSSKTESLLLPYLIYSVFNILLFGFFKLVHHADVYSWFRFGGLWFLITLFFISLIYYVMDAALLNNTKPVVRTGVLSLMAIIMLIAGMSYGGGKMGTHDTITATSVNFIFFHLGYCIKSLNKRLYTESLWKRALFLLIGCAGLLLLTYMAPKNPSPVDVNINRFGNRTMFFFHALLGIAGMILFSAGVQKNNVIEYLGRNSLLMLLLHIPLWRTFDMLCQSIGIWGYTRLSLTFIAALAFSLVLLYLINKYVPELKGKFNYSKVE